MAKEAELKSVDLKVSVNCCEGCKRKVLKALSIKGVLRAEIHPSLPKVTVTGNVDVEILIKKLSKAGKSAEVLAEEMQKPLQRDERVSEKEKEPDYDKSSIDNGKRNEESKSNGNKDESNKDKEGDKNLMVVEPTIVSTIPQMSLYQTITPQAKVYYPVEPIAVAMPCYAMNTDPAPAAYYIQDQRYYEMPSYRPSPPRSQAMAAVSDYFNEDNTVGCRIM